MGRVRRLHLHAGRDANVLVLGDRVRRHPDMRERRRLLGDLPELRRSHLSKRYDEGMYL